MSVFSRANDIIQSHLNALLDKAEDPQKLTGQLISEMDDAISEARQLAATMLSQKKVLTRELTLLTRKMSQWQQQAATALMQQREDIARTRLQQKQRLATQHKELTRQLEQTDEAISRLDNKIGQLKFKLRLLQNKGPMPQRATLTSAAKQSEAMAAAQQSLARSEIKLARLENQYDCVYLAQEKNNLKAQFAQLGTDQEIEAQLTLLKQQRSA